MTASELNEKLIQGGAKFYGEVVVVAREKAVEKTKGGLFIPESIQARQQFGAIVAFGDESKLPAKGLAVGDAVYVPVYGGVVVKQKVGADVYVLEALYDKDVLLSYRGSGDVELEAGGSQTSA